MTYTRIPCPHQVLVVSLKNDGLDKGRVRSNSLGHQTFVVGSFRWTLFVKSSENVTLVTFYYESIRFERIHIKGQVIGVEEKKTIIS